MNDAFHHFRDMQRACLAEVARAFLNPPLGDYRLLDEFKTAEDNTWAESVLTEVLGPNFRSRKTLERENLTDNIPTYQGKHSNKDTIITEDNEQME